jgi:hypothetical protein
MVAVTLVSFSYLCLSTTLHHISPSPSFIVRDRDRRWPHVTPRRNCSQLDLRPSMPSPSPLPDDQFQNEKRSPALPVAPLTIPNGTERFDLEANRPSSTFARSPRPTVDVAVNSAPVSTTSLPVTGLNSAPTHGRRRRRHKVRTLQSEDPQGATTAGREQPQPRRANSLPSTAVVHADSGPVPRLAWNTLLEPAKKIKAAQPSLRECIVNTIKYSWRNVMLVLIPVAWAVVSPGPFVAQWLSFSVNDSTGRTKPIRLYSFSP